MPKFNLILDSQMISTYQTCPLLFWYKYQEHLRLSTEGQKVAADKGTLVHHLMDLYYGMRAFMPNGNKLEQASHCISIFKQTKTTEALFPNGIENKDESKTWTVAELEDFICKRFMLYVNRYMMDDFNVQLNNGVAGVEVGFSNILYETDEVRFILEGRIDLLNIIGDDYPCWVDHKTEGKYNPLYKYKTQFKTYALATNYEYGMVNYFGMQEDKDNKLLKANKLFRRELIHFPKWMIDEWKDKLIWYVYMPIYTRGLVPGFNPERLFYTQRNDSACSGAFDSNPCQMTHLCEEGNWEMKQRIKEFKYKVVESWTPWKVDEVKSESTR